MPHKKLLLITIAFALFSYKFKLSSKKMIIIGIGFFTLALLAIFLKNYILAEQIADVGFFLILVGIIKKTIETRKL